MRSTLWLPILLFIVVVAIIGGIIFLPTPETHQHDQNLTEDLENPELITQEDGTTQSNQSTNQQEGIHDTETSDLIGSVTDILEGTLKTIPPSDQNAFSENESIGGMVTPAAEGPESLAIKGQVQDSQGEPISGATIYSQNNEPVQSTTAGLFNIEPIEQNEVVLRVEKDGFQTLEQRVARGAVNITLTLVEEGALAGQVVDQKGDPIGLAQVNIQATKGIWAKNLNADRDGRFVIDNAPDMMLSLKAELQGFDETPDSTKQVQSPSPSLVTLVLKRPTFFISGRVINRNDQTGVPNFSLHLKPENSDTSAEQTTQSDGNGLYKFDNLQRGTYIISSMVEENSVRNLVVPLDEDFKSVRIYENPAENVNFEVIQGREVSGTITSNDGQPVANAEVYVAKLGAPKTTSQNDGSYRLSGVPFKSYPGTESRTDFQIQIFASHPDYGDGMSEPLPNQDESLISNIDIALKGISTLRGNVKDESDNPVPNATIMLVNLISNEQQTKVSNANGIFVFENVSAADQPNILEGTHLLQANKENMGQAQKQIVIKPNDEQFVNLTMKSGGPIRGFISDSEGQPLPGTVVTTWLSSGGKVNAVADENGFYELSSLPDGTYDLSFRLDGQPALTAHLYRVEPNTTDANAVLMPDEWIITGTVTDQQTNIPLQRYDIHLEARPSVQNARPYALSKSINTPDGTYQITVSEPGRFLLTFYADGYDPVQGSVQISPTYRDRQFLNIQIPPTEQYGGVTGTLIPPDGTYLVAVSVSGKDIYPTNGNSFSLTDIPAGKNYLYFYVSEEPGGVGNQLAGALQVTIRADQITNIGSFTAQQLKATRY